VGILGLKINKLNKGGKMRRIILNHHKIIKENIQEFYNTFGVSLKDFFDPILGFDIVKFDEEIIKPSANESTKDKILRDYGQNGVEVIENLL